MRPARFWRRYAAYSLDISFVLGLALPLAWPMVGLGLARVDEATLLAQDRLYELFDAMLAAGVDPLSDLPGLAADPALRALLTGLATDLAALVFQALALVVAIAAAWFIATEASTWQASPGKRLLGLKVTDLEGGRPGPGRVMARFAAGAPSWLLLHVGHAAAALRPEHRALHDRIAGTRVLLAEDAPERLPGWARNWLVLQLMGFVALVGWVLVGYALLAWAAFAGNLA